MPRTTITAVSGYTHGDRTVTFDCETERDAPRLSDYGTVPVTLRFYDPATFRFEFDANPLRLDDGDSTGDSDGTNDGDGTDNDGGGDRKHPVPPEFPEYHEERVRAPVDLDVRETDGEVVVETATLRVRVGLNPWTFRVEDAAGDPIFENQVGDVDVRGASRVDPLWFDEEEINHGPHRITGTGLAFELSPGERIYGLGEKFTGFDRVGQELESWHVEPLGTETGRAYKNVPFHLSTNGYGLLVDTTCRVRYDLGRSSTASGTVAVDDDSLAFVFFYGPQFTDVLETYTAFTGRPDRPPKWSFGVWMSRLGYESREQLEAITDRLREEEIPCDVVHLDPFWMRDGHACDLVWDTEQFPDPAGMIEDLHDRGFHLSLWEHPHVPVGTDAFAEAVEAGYLVEDGAGDPYVMDRTCQGSYRGGLVDFTDPDAVEWWREKHHRLLAMGVDTFKTDYGEYVPEDAVFANGRSGRSMHNLYPHLYNRAVYRTIAEERGDPVVWARAAWTGGQRYPVHWGGDPQTTFNGMAAALRGGLSASLSGFGFWSHDIGGFRGEPTPELYARWAQFGLLSSHARCHGTTPREPWAFGERAVEVFRRYARLRYRLLPYLYSYAEQAARTGLPVVRPLVLEFQDDERARQLDTQFLLGDALLVAPVFGGTTERDVYLPEGEWVDHWTGERHDGGRTVTKETPLDVLPLYRRAGHVVPMREAAETVTPGTPERLTLHAVAFRDGPTAASVPYYDEDEDRVVEFRVDVDDAGTSVEVGRDGPTAVGTVEAVVEGPTAAPETVRVAGEPLDRVADDPVAGEWTYDDGADRVRLVR